MAENTTVAKVARENAEQLEDQKLITVARSVDGAVLWQDMVQIPNSNSLDRMRDLQLKSQEINQEYLYMRTRLAEAEQNAAGAITSREFYVRVVDEISKRLQSFNGDATPTATAEAPDELTAQAQDYVNTVLNSAEVLPLGTPVVYSSSRGVIKTILAGGSVFSLPVSSLLFANGSAGWGWNKEEGEEPRMADEKNRRWT